MNDSQVLRLLLESIYYIYTLGNRLQHKNSEKTLGDSYTELVVISQGYNNPRESGTSASETLVQVQNNRTTRRQRHNLELQNEDLRLCVYRVIFI